ncbi:MAG: hypothetical protein [Caudoviricetes sp.]|nr:MAG: hypothetical protein [Caudoviricetes sp.]
MTATAKTKSTVINVEKSIVDMDIDERIFHIQQEAKPVGKKTKSYQYNYADYKAIWDGGLKDLCGKYQVEYTATTEIGPSFAAGENIVVPTIKLICRAVAVGYNPPKEGDPAFYSSSKRRAKEFDILIPLSGSAQQKEVQKEVGASLTYYRRYALLALFGLSVTDDAEDIDSMARNKPSRRNTSSLPKPNLASNMQHSPDVGEKPEFDDPGQTGVWNDEAEF